MLLKALEEAMKENLIRPFILDGKRLSPQLKQLVGNSNALDLSAAMVELILSLINQLDAKSKKHSSLFTPREFDILEKVKAGRPNKVIAKELSISESTVKFHLANIYGKAGRAESYSGRQRYAKPGQGIDSDLPA